MSPEQYRQWIQQMGDFGVRFLRVYTLHQPAFYQALRDYNFAHPDYPIYLLHGVYLPDESYLESHDLYDPKPTEAFTRELHDLSDAVSGDLERELDVGRAGGSYTADVSPWVAAWIIGVEWDPNAIHKSEKKNRSQPPYRGKYFTTSATKTQVNSTESWIAARMDELASAEVKRGRSVPIAFVNWPTADPLDHGSNEPNPTEDLVSVDANHVLPTKRWPGRNLRELSLLPLLPRFPAAHEAVHVLRPARRVPARSVGGLSERPQDALRASEYPVDGHGVRGSQFSRGLRIWAPTVAIKAITQSWKQWR